MSPALAHGKVDRWLLDHEDWIAEGGTARLALCEDWRKVAVEFGAGHPAAIGCLLALVRDAWSDPFVLPDYDGAGRWYVCSGAGGLLGQGPRLDFVPASGATELHALVAALEAAPP
jgi:hypothetical protein